MTKDELINGETYILKRDYIQLPTIRHNFGSEVIFLGEISEDGEKALVKIKESKDNPFMVPIELLVEKK